MIEVYKNERIAKLLGLSSNNSKLGAIGDTLAFGMMPEKKEDNMS